MTFTCYRRFAAYSGLFALLTLVSAVAWPH